MKKRLFGILLCAVMITSLLTACGAKETGGKDGGKTIGVCMPTKDLQRWNQDGENMEKLLKEAGYKVDLQYASNDIQTQVSQIETMIANDVSLLELLL